jgi:hypothetical protein
MFVGDGVMRSGARLVALPAIAGVSAGVLCALFFRSLRPRAGAPAPRRSAAAAFAAAIVAAAAAFVVAAAPGPWIALGPFGAGPLTELPLFVLPLAVLLGVLVGRHASRNEGILPST